MADDATPISGAKDSSSPASQSEESRELIIQSILEHTMKSVIVDYASQMHKLIKTGGIPASELNTPSSRHEIFPSLYEGKTQEEVQLALDRFATEIPSRSRKRKIRLMVASEANNSLGDDDSDKDDADDDADEDFKVEDEHEKAREEKPSRNMGESNEDIPPAKAISSGVDIWGRLPPKEPKSAAECTLCGRNVSTTRFASHLEKCMGLSTRPSTGIPSRSSIAGVK